MPGEPLLVGVAVVGTVVAVAAGSAWLYRVLPRVYPRAATRLDERTHRLVRAAVSLGVPVGGLGAVLSLVDTVGTVRALGEGSRGLLAGLAILIPVRVASALVDVGVALLVGAAAVAAAVELRNARR